MLTDPPPLLDPGTGSALVRDPATGRWTSPDSTFALEPVEGAIDLVDGTKESERGQDERIKLAYRFYSLVYPVVAFLAMKIIWSGRLGPLVRFYRDGVQKAASAGSLLIDIGLGDGSLTQIVLKRVAPPPRFLGVDLSRNMLKKCARRLRKHAEKLLYVRDACDLNVPEGRFDHVVCFGTLHVFSDPGIALRKIRALLSPGGTLSGSYLLRPGTRARDRFCDRLIEWGLLSTSLREPDLDALFASSGLRYVQKERNGKMLLFTVAKA